MTLEVIAIDGPVGSGKSTVARELAGQLGWSFLDTGAMYRAVTAEVLFRGADPFDEVAVVKIAQHATIETLPTVSIDGRFVDDAIRTPQVNEAVSVVAAYPQVRSAMVQQQRNFARHQSQGTVVEGRDIATIVFPDARLKIFLTASIDERSRRRHDEDPQSIRRRDSIDSEREHSPLRQSNTAKMIDTTGRSVNEVVQEILACLKQ